MIGFVRDFLKGLFAFYLGAVLVTPFILLIAFHKPWWVILLYVPAVLFLVGRVQLEIEQIKVKRETTVIVKGRVGFPGVWSARCPRPFPPTCCVETPPFLQ